MAKSEWNVETLKDDIKKYTERRLCVLFSTFNILILLIWMQGGISSNYQEDGGS